MKALSVRQPWAYLLCSGIKDVENRTWKLPEKYKGERVLIHASSLSKNGEYGNIIYTTYGVAKPKDYSQIYALNKEQREFLTYGAADSNVFETVREYYRPMTTSAIIGSVRFGDCVINHPSIWAEKSQPADFDEYGYPAAYYNKIYNWVATDAVLFEKPILNVKGKLGFWDYDLPDMPKGEEVVYVTETFNPYK